jgi:hypothetical protein
MVLFCLIVKVDFSRLASRDGYMGEWEKAGDVWSMEGASEWFCNTPEEEWTGNPERIRQDFVEGVGDKRQEIVRFFFHPLLISNRCL